MPIAIDRADPSVAPSRIQRVRHELKRRPVEVVRVETITPHFRSITFRDDSLADFVSASFDDHVKFMLGAEVNADAGAPTMRDYTPRRFDRAARELTIEFALHGDGPVCTWAAQATMGQRAMIGGPKGSLIVPVDYDWHLLIGDETGLPAMARRLDELPAKARAIVFAHVGDPVDRRVFASRADVTAQWFDAMPDLIATVRERSLPPGDGYAWCAGEATAMATLRRILVDDKGHDRHAIRAAAYWKQGSAAHHENLDG